MYKIISGKEVIGNSETLVFIRKHSNGCYIQCPESEAEGICVKLPITLTDEDGSTIETVQDTVFSLSGHQLEGSKATVTYEKFNGAVEIEALNREFDNLLVSMLEGAEGDA